MNIMWAVERPGPFGEPWVSAHATKASALVDAANWGRDVQVVEIAALPAAEFAALSARVAKLEAALTDAAESLDDAEKAIRDAADELDDDAAAVDAHVDAEAAEDAAADARAALEEPCKGDSPEAAEEDKS